MLNVSIDPDRLYDDSTLIIGLGLSDSAVAKARRSGALRSSRKGGRTLYLGRWILDWLTGDEPRRVPEREAASC